MNERRRKQSLGSPAGQAPVSKAETESLFECPHCQGKGEVAATPGQPGDGPMMLCPRCGGEGRISLTDRERAWFEGDA